MTAKDYLMETLRLRREIEGETERAEAQLRRAVGEADRVKERMEELKFRVLLAVNAVPDPTEKKVLFHRYFCGMTWGEVGVALGMSESAARRRHTAALRHIGEQVWPPCCR